MKHYGLEIPEGSSIKNMTAPSGTSFPSLANAAEMFFRTDDSGMYFHNGTEWLLIGGTTVATQTVVDTFTSTGSPGGVDYTLTTGPNSENDLLVFVGGVYQEQSTYSISGSTLTLTENPAEGVVIETTLLPTSISGNTLTSSSQTAVGGSPPETTFSVTYTVGNLFVYLNGVKLVEDTDFTATNGTTVVLTESVVADDIIAFEAFSTFSVNANFNLVEDTTPQLGGDLDMNTFDIVTSEDGGSISITAGDATVGSTFGGAVTIKSGKGSLAGDSGDITIQTADSSNAAIGGYAGDINLTGGDGGDYIGCFGGDINLRAGAAGDATASTAGYVTLTGGSGNNTYPAGNVVLKGGLGGAAGVGGAIKLTGGITTATTANAGDIIMNGGTTAGGSPYRAGSITFTGGDASVPGCFPGDVNFIGGNADGSNNIAGGGSVITGGFGSSSGSGSAGGQLYLKSGSARTGNNGGGQLTILGGDGLGSGLGGKVVILGGSSAATNGGNVTITGGESLSIYPGGDVTISGGEGSGSGDVKIASGSTTIGGSAQFMEGSTNGTNYVELKAPNSITTSRTITLPQDADSAGDVITTDGSGVLSFMQPAGRKNLVINGSMNIWQRETTFAAAAHGVYTADRWRYIKVSTGVVTISRQTSAAVSDKDFNFYFNVNVTTADTSIAVTDYAIIATHIEGSDIIGTKFGKAGARGLVLTFHHAHTKTGTHTGCIRNDALTESYIFEYTQTVSNTFQKTTITIPGETSGAWVYTNGNIGFQLMFTMMAGTNANGTVDTWNSSSAFSTSNQVNNYDSTSNAFRLANVQLEIGDDATEFELLSFGQELANCQRYFEKSYQYTNYATDINTTGMCQYRLQGITVAVHLPIYTERFAVTKATIPTVTAYSPGNGTINKATDYTGGAADIAAVAAIQGHGSFRMDITDTSKNNYNFGFQWTAQAEIG